MYWCVEMANGMGVVERQLVWLCWKVNLYGCGEAAVGMGVLEGQLIRVW